MFCIAINNVGGLPATSGRHQKHNRLRAIIKNYQLDGVLIQESNQHWAKVKNKDKLNTRIKEWFAIARSEVAYNVHEKPQYSHQWGGTGMILLNNLTPQSTKDTQVDSLG